MDTHFAMKEVCSQYVRNLQERNVEQVDGNDEIYPHLKEQQLVELQYQLEV